MFISKYTCLLTIAEKRYLLNTYNSALIELEESSYNKLSGKTQHCINEEMLSKEETELLKVEGFLVDENEELSRILSNKMKYHSSKYNQSQTLKIDIGITDRCNFSCPYCFENGNKNTGRFVVNKYTYFELFSDIRNYILSHIDANIRDVEIVWYGGEPSLELDFICFVNKKMMEDATTQGFNYNNILITNGYAINIESIEKLKDQNVKYIQITLDGLQKTHNNRRNTVPKTDSFETILKNVEKILQSKIEVVIRINIDSTNVDEIEPLMDYLAGRFGNDFVGKFLFISFGRVFGSRNSLTHMEYENVYHQFYLKASKLGFITPDFEETEVGAFCGAETMNHDLVVDFNGNKYKCWNDIFDLSLSVGNVKEINVLEDEEKESNVEMKYMEQLSLDNVNSGKCLDCELLKYCGGLCPYNRKMLLEGTDDNIYTDNICKEIVRRRIATHIEAYIEKMTEIEKESSDENK